VLGTINSDMISFEKDFYSSGKIDVAVTRIDHNDALNVSGILGTFTVVTVPNFSSINTLTVSATNVVGLTSAEGTATFNSFPDSVLINPTIGINEPDQQHELSV